MLFRSLGMAVVWGTVKDHRGYIDITSTEGQGTEITLYFPITRKVFYPEAEIASIQELMGTGESILVVDDIEAQRQIAAEEEAQRKREAELEEERQRAEEDARQQAGTQQAATATAVAEEEALLATAAKTGALTPPPAANELEPTVAPVVEPTFTPGVAAVVVKENSFVDPWEVDSLPVVLKESQVAWSRSALYSRRKGVVVVQATVDADGRVEAVKVLRADHNGFGIPQSVVEAVRMYHFKPGTKDGVPIKQIVRRLGHSRGLVRKVIRGLRSDVFRTRESTLDPFLPLLDEEWNSGCHNGAELRRRLMRRGFAGSLRVVTEWATRHRRAEQVTSSHLQKVPSARTIARMLTLGRDHLTKAETVIVAAIEASVPALNEAREIIDHFHGMIRTGTLQHSP